MAKEPKAITPNPDTAQEATAVTNDNTKIHAWDFTTIAKSYGLDLTTGYDHYPAEFWMYMGMKSYCDPMYQYAKLISALHRLNFFGMNDEADEVVPMSLSALLGELDMEEETLQSIIALAVKDWDAIEAGLARSYDNAGQGASLSVADALKAVNELIDNPLKEEELIDNKNKDS